MCDKIFLQLLIFVGIAIAGRHSDVCDVTGTSFCHYLVFKNSKIFVKKYQKNEEKNLEQIWEMYTYKYFYTRTGTFHQK